MLQENISLRPFNTFSVESTARWFVQIHNESEACSIAQSDIIREYPCVVLGGGSNVLFVGDVNAVVVQNECKGISVIYEDEMSVIVRFASGENWHECVQWCVDRGYGGLENLALIPGTIGAAPIQNIGAYGVEVESVIECVHAVQLGTGEHLRFSRAECAFGYRDSIFKHEWKQRCIITAVDCRLAKAPQLNLSYGELLRELESRGITSPGILDVFRAVVDIRTRKLPSVNILGNAGSFFKNPVVSKDHAEHIKKEYTAMPTFEQDGNVKIPAAWLIEQCGCKGLRKGDAGVYERHALVIVNHGTASGRDLLQLANEVRNRVRERFGIELEIEVRIIEIP